MSVRIANDEGFISTRKAVRVSFEARPTPSVCLSTLSIGFHRIMADWITDSNEAFSLKLSMQSSTSLALASVELKLTLPPAPSQNATRPLPLLSPPTQSSQRFSPSIRHSPTQSSERSRRSLDTRVSTSRYAHPTRTKVGHARRELTTFFLPPFSSLISFFSRLAVSSNVFRLATSPRSTRKQPLRTTSRQLSSLTSHPVSSTSPSLRPSHPFLTPHPVYSRSLSALASAHAPPLPFPTLFRLHDLHRHLPDSSNPGRGLVQTLRTQDWILHPSVGRKGVYFEGKGKGKGSG